MDHDRTSATSPAQRSGAAAIGEHYDQAAVAALYRAAYDDDLLHIGLYPRGDESVPEAAHRTLETMAAQPTQLGEGAHVVDFGSGYGGTARFLARRFGCRVTGINISQTQNATARARVTDDGLDRLVAIVAATFEAVPLADGTADVVWSQDSLLLATDHTAPIHEAARLLRPGGELVFTDAVRADDASDAALAAVMPRSPMAGFASWALYRRAAAEAGFDEVAALDWSEHLTRHYTRVHDETAARAEELAEAVGRDRLDQTLESLASWARAGRDGVLRWGLLHFRRR